jgi:SulP family sulfate permease
MNEPQDEQTLRTAVDAVSRRQLPQRVEVFEAEGAFFFGVAELLRDNLDVGKMRARVLVLRMRHVLALDASGIRALRDGLVT